MRIKIYLVCLSVLLSSLIRAEKLPVEVFAKSPAFTDMTLSRDGKFVAYKAEYEDAERVFIRELETKIVQAVEMPSNATNFYGRIGRYELDIRKATTDSFLYGLCGDR